MVDEGGSSIFANGPHLSVCEEVFMEHGINETNIMLFKDEKIKKLFPRIGDKINSLFKIISIKLDILEN